MRDVLATEELKIPEGVTVTVKSLIISVTGPRGVAHEKCAALQHGHRRQQGHGSPQGLARA